jgi:peptidoglycan L-alanyl-D-glutamate endopeptidase CwlK
MAGLHPKLIQVVGYAITRTKIDFGVIEGVRTVERQKELFDSDPPATETMDSKHIPVGDPLFGYAVDLLAYIGSRGSWELNLYDDVAAAMREGAEFHDVGIRWGAAWTVSDITKWGGTMEDAMNSYIDLRRSQGKRPFIDAPHFELIV